jgi:ATP-dependent exoDNAse (exonuclease V) alpha subunit
MNTIVMISICTVMVILAFLFGKKLGNRDTKDAGNKSKATDPITLYPSETLENNTGKNTIKDALVIETSEKNNLPKNFELTDDFHRIFDLMENTNDSLFITGKAGTGKSTLIEYFRIKTSKKAVFLAPTGVAALNIRGKTIHSMFQFPPEIITSDKIKGNAYKEEIREIFKKTDIMIIDEISMVRADLLEGVNYILQKFRDKDKSFGGVQMAFIGDMYQLPPVVDRTNRMIFTHGEKFLLEATAYEYLQRKYGGPYFFNSDSFKKADFKYCELNTMFRQKDDDYFVDILNMIRENNVTEGVLDKLNKRCVMQPDDELDDNRITLCSTNNAADNINRKRMAKLPTKLFSYEAKVSGIFKEKITDKDYPVDKNLTLKKDAQVMMIKNDKDGNWVNGTIGIVKKLTENGIEVKIHGTTFNIKRETWEAVDYEYDEETDRLKANVVGTYTQYPLKPAWAITIHKSQGKTFDKVIIDLGRGAFAHGQTYVALSRCKTLNGIFLKQPIKMKDVILDNTVADFHKKMKTNI